MYTEARVWAAVSGSTVGVDEWLHPSAPNRTAASTAAAARRGIGADRSRARSHIRGMRGGGGGGLYRVAMPYAVQTPVYDGPFDLLLHLILREQVDLYEVSLRAIVDAFLAEVAADGRRTSTWTSATEFLLIAATLVELKSRRLLPDETDLDLDEELALWEERDLLIARLLECKTYKDAAAALAHLSLEAARSCPRTAGLEDRFLNLTPDLLEGVTPGDLAGRPWAGALTPRPVPMVEIAHIHRCASASSTRWRSWSTSCPAWVGSASAT